MGLFNTRHEEPVVPIFDRIDKTYVNPVNPVGDLGFTQTSLVGQ
jgi:hypothetical protein